MSKEIILSKKAGYCFGVKRALDIAQSTGYGAYTLGPLIHNPQVVEKLSEKGIHSIDSLNDISAGTLIIRSHGVPKHLVPYDQGFTLWRALFPIQTFFMGRLKKNPCYVEDCGHYHHFSPDSLRKTLENHMLEVVCLFHFYRFWLFAVARKSCE